MRLLFGVVGEGMGHATRSKVTLEWLLAKGHQIQVVVSNRAHGYLDRAFSNRFPRCHEAREGEAAIDVIEIQGLVIKYVDNEFDEAASVVHNVLRVPGMLVENVGAYYEDVVRFRPQAVISDFDSFAYIFAKLHQLPIVSIDNQALIYRCNLPTEVIDEDRGGYLATRAFVQAKLPGCDRYIVTSFFYPEVRPRYVAKTTLVPPILRRAVLDARPTPATEGKHWLVYQTSQSDKSLLPTLASWGEKCIVYGLGRDEQVGNLTLKSFSEQGFVDDLASSRGVVCNGGLSLIGEAVSLHKPVLSVPVRGQYEQILNAFYIRELGYGTYARTIQLDVLQQMSAGHANFAARVSTFRHDGNQKLFATLAEQLEQFEARAFAAELRSVVPRRASRREPVWAVVRLQDGASPVEDGLEVVEVARSLAEAQATADRLGQGNRSGGARYVVKPTSLVARG